MQNDNLKEYIKGKNKQKNKKIIKISAFFIMIIMLALAAYNLVLFGIPEVVKTIEYLQYADLGKSNSSEIIRVKVNDRYIPFEEGKTEYNINVDANEELINLEFVKGSEGQVIYGANKYSMVEKDKDIKFTVHSPDGSSQTEYTLHMHKTENTYLRNIEIRDFSLNEAFSKDNSTYTANIYDSVNVIELAAASYDENCNITVTTNTSDDVLNQSGGNFKSYLENIQIGTVITIKVTNTMTQDERLYTVTLQKKNLPSATTIGAGTTTTYKPPFKGTYKMEVYGQRGGNAYIKGRTTHTISWYVSSSSSSKTCYHTPSSSHTGGKGGYASGEKLLSRTDILNITTAGSVSDYSNSDVSVDGNNSYMYSSTYYGGNGGTSSIKVNNSDSQKLQANGGTRASAKFTFTPSQSGGSSGESSARCTSKIGDGGGNGNNGTASVSANVFTNAKATTGGSSASKAVITPLAYEGNEDYKNTTFPLLNIETSVGEMKTEFNPANHEYYIDVPSNTHDTILTFTTIEGAIVEGGKEQTIEDLNLGDTTKTIKITADGVTYTYTIHILRTASGESKLKNIIRTSNGTTENIPNFDEDKYEYTVTLPYNTNTDQAISAIKLFPGQTITGEETKAMTGSPSKYVITVVSEDGRSRSKYNVTLQREASTRLQSLKINGYSVSDYNDSTFVYSHVIDKNSATAEVEAIPWDDGARVEVKGAGYIGDEGKIIQIKVSKDGVENTLYQIDVTKTNAKSTNNFSYSTSPRTYTVPVSGWYKIETWGASGGTTQGDYKKIYGGNGGYASAEYKLEAGDVITVWTGGAGSSGRTAGTHYGGKGTSRRKKFLFITNWYHNVGGGGGATEVRLNDKIIIMTGGGGGSEGYRDEQGEAGGYMSRASYSPQGISGRNKKGDGGAGGGYVGGKSYKSGGSTYLALHNGYSSPLEKLNSETIRNTKIVDGNGYAWSNFTRLSYTGMPSPNGGIMKGNTGNGYVRITKLDNKLSNDNYLKDIKVSKGTLEPVFDTEKTEYTLTVGEIDEVTITGIPQTAKAKVKGNGIQKLNTEETKVVLTVTAENGDKRDYTITVKRDSSTNAKPQDIQIKGINTNAIDFNSEKHGILNPESFDPEIKEYTMTIPYSTSKVTFDVTKGQQNQTVTGDGERTLEVGENTITIKVTAEDGEHVEEYTYKIIREEDHTAKLTDLIVKNSEEDISQTMETFEKEKSEYTIMVKNSVEKLMLEAKTDAEEAIIQIGENSSNKGDLTFESEINLNEGMNDIKVTITSKDNLTTTYIVHAYKEMKDNVLLKELSVKNGENNVIITPNFNRLLNTYESSVEIDVHTVKIIAEAVDENAKVTVLKDEQDATNRTEEEIELHAGLNTININVKNGERTGTYTVNIIKEASNNNYLQVLEIENGELVTEGYDEETEDYTYVPDTFNKEKQEYTVKVASNNDKLDLIIEPEDKNAKYEVINNDKLLTGENEVIIRVTAENGEKRDYKLKVIKEGSNNCNLINITVDGNKLEGFDKEILEYAIEVENNAKEISIFGEKEDIRSTVYGNGKYTLLEGENRIIINVEAEDGTEKNYTIAVTRKQSSNCNLKKVLVNNKIEALKQEDDTYKAIVSSELEEITIEGIAEDENATVEGNGKLELIGIGNVEKTLTVIAADGTTSKEYTVVIEREKSDNAYLEYLLAQEGGLTPEFNKENLNYEVKVLNNTEKLTLQVCPEDKIATYEIDVDETVIEIDGETKVNGEKTLEIPLLNNSTNISVKVMSSSGNTTLTYNVKIVKQDDFGDLCDITNLKVSKEDGELQYTPNFNENTLFYELEVPYEIEKVNVEAIAKYITNSDTENPDTEISKREVTVIGNGEYDLKIGTNIIPVKVIGKYLEEVENKPESAQINKEYEKTYQVKITRKLSNNANLSELSVAGEIFEQNFDPNTTLYNLETRQAKLTINAVPEDDNASYEIIYPEEADQTGKLKQGKNIIIVRVTAQDKKTTKDYVLEVSKLSNDNNYLESLEIDGYGITPEFNKNELQYNVLIPEEMNSININAVPEDLDAIVEGAGSVLISDDEQTVNIKVISSSGKERIYQINVLRGQSSNNYLELLEISSGELTPEFSKETNEYTVDVKSNIENITVTGKPEDLTATVKIIKGDTQYVDEKEAEKGIKVSGIIPLEVGENEIKVVVTAADGTENIYTIKVKKEKSISTKLDNLEIENYEIKPSFMKDTLDYVTYVDNEIVGLDYAVNEGTEIVADITKTGTEEIEPRNGKLLITTEDKNAIVTVTGNSNFKEGNNDVTITVKSLENEEETIYTLVVNRKPFANNFLEYLHTNKGTLAPEFNETTLNYVINVDNSIDKITLDAKAKDAKAEVLMKDDDKKVGQAKHEYMLNVGDNEITIDVTDENGINRRYTVNIIKSKDINVGLKDLQVRFNGEFTEIIPMFENGIKDYEVTAPVGVTIAEIIAEPIVDTCTVEGDGEVSIITEDGQLDVVKEIVVKAEDGVTTETYTLTIHRTLSNSAELIELLPSSGTLKYTENELEKQYFKYKQYEYNLELGTEDKTLSFEVETEDVFAKVSGIEEMEVPLGNSTRKILVTAEDGTTTKEYTININRIALNDARLKSLQIKTSVEGDYYTIKPEFEPDAFEYTVMVEPGKIQLSKEDIIAEPMVEGTVITCNNVSLENEETKFEIETLAPDKITKQVYTLKIKKIDSNVGLEYVKVDGKQVSAEGNPLIYNEFIDIKDEVEVELKALNETSRIEVIEPEVISTTEKGLLNFALPTTEETTNVKFKVISESGEEMEYLLVLTKKSDDNSLLSLSVDDEVLQVSEDGKYYYNIDSVEETGKDVLVKAVTNNKYANIQIDKDEVNVNETSKNIHVTQNANIKVLITVTSQTGEIKEYELYIRTLENNTRLSRVEVDSKEVTDFEEGTNTYTAEVEVKQDGNNDYEINLETVTKEATIELYDENSKIAETSEEQTGKLKYTVTNLNLGEKEYKIIVRLSDTIFTEYTLKLNVVEGKKEGILKGSIHTSPTEVTTQSNIADIYIYSCEDTKNVINWDEAIENTTNGVLDELHLNLKGISEKAKQTTKSDGTFEITIEEGEYDILIDKEGYLDIIHINVKVEKDKTVDIGVQELTAGDINKDGVVEILDKISIGEQNDKTTSDVDFRSECDINDDGIVDILDKTEINGNNDQRRKIIKSEEGV